MKILLPPELLWMCPVAVPDLVRLGQNMDGGYIVTRSAMNHAQALLGFGLGEDFSFEQDWRVHKPADPIHVYDASVSRDRLAVRYNTSVRGHLNLQQMYDEFFQSTVQHLPEYISADNFAQALERTGVDQVFIKMDIEGSEYSLIDLIAQHHDRIAGIAMEWHHCADRSGKWADAVAKWQEHYAIVHVHGNNHVRADADGIFGCMELTHVRRDLIASTELRKNIHIPNLDYSNVYGSEDHEYYFE